jgi:hypothetical protein
VKNSLPLFIMYFYWILNIHKAFVVVKLTKVTNIYKLCNEPKASGVINPSEYSHYRLVEYSKLNSQISGLKYNPIAF